MSWSVNGFLCFLGLASPALAWQQLEGRDRPGNGLARPCGSSFYCAKQKKLLLINPLQLLVGKLFTIPSAEVPRNVLFELTGGKRDSCQSAGCSDSGAVSRWRQERDDIIPGFLAQLIGAFRAINPHFKYNWTLID